ncbi:MAG TPA: class I SAM-dependent methyltransferase [Dehalococcoidia bacterium]|jgi:ubiquinone/menaquinone biosynthesis C-methylase UbiE|nr:SAM-dependent methyltransferase [Chloroflexota bacterium]MDP5876777.1 class I SAM-dependent methyltransferase [Dehalococcoidia bacterium]MDP6273596.1 class I SAM-dependent methyltransferase [Dehalococcoidia bacterium]MDP7160128.1 class I SAM-dependent methyltransferase [Dehalococcoidia bacterium]MDP7213361.1 class I SAM-dependent methyltransferase [Dehalococcoidia bacterium]|tara:strand:- start:2355 stop:2924 length:570 start_codon:yes stop_codon:yes gene_type:complete
MPTKFPVEHADVLLSKSDPGAVDPNLLIAELPIRTDMKVADVGSGPGYFSLPLAKYLYDGTVYAVDVQQGMLDIVESQAEVMRVNNIELMLSKETKIPLDDESVDVALLSNVLHETSSPTRFIRDVSRIVKKGGWIAIMEWKKEETKSGPPLKERIALEDVEKLIGKIDLPIKARRLIGTSRYLILVEK